MISGKTESVYTVHKSDKFKNCEFSNDPKFEHVKTLERCYEYEGKYAVAIFDPPYSSQGGGHTGTNCDLKRSASKMQFNNQYGTTFQYSPVLILSMVSECMKNAFELLKPNGFLLVKCKDYKGLPYTSEVTRLAREEGHFSYWGTYVFSTRDKVVRNPSDYSNMVVFRKTIASNAEKKCATLTGNGTIDQARIDYQSLALNAKRSEQNVKEEYAELLVHYAELCRTHKNFVEQLSKSYNFDKEKLHKFLKFHNMETEDKFMRNKANGLVLRQARACVSDGGKQQKMPCREPETTRTKDRKLE